jgi:hypothetical protein
MSGWATPGVRCVLVAPNPLWATRLPRNFVVPVVGETYTIRERRSFDFGPDAITLDEIRNPPAVVVGPPDLLWEACFAVTRFRPLAYPSQSIEHDVALFKPAPAHAPVLNSEDA